MKRIPQGIVLIQLLRASAQESRRLPSVISNIYVLSRFSLNSQKSAFSLPTPEIFHLLLRQKLQFVQEHPLQRTDSTPFMVLSTLITTFCEKGSVDNNRLKSFQDEPMQMPLLWGCLDPSQECSTTDSQREPGYSFPSLVLRNLSFLFVSRDYVRPLFSETPLENCCSCLTGSIVCVT